ncbi:hypothetical protein Pmani_012381 [Petrolisthes manimaculis]|uniref:Uncharacterized protein n=1 Tax=Petrolisthes manimaculis TaxID=1843537 RepID=A0AAE1PZD6_9EUCA|nr:hypothetical protein Pmani_012381 [Petrolisthes manimaculis]
MGLGNSNLGPIQLNLPLQGSSVQRTVSLPASSPGAFSSSSTQQHPTRPGSGNSVGLVGSGNFPVNSALMIGDYVTPGSIILPTQGIQLNTHPAMPGANDNNTHTHTHTPPQ